MRRSLIPFIPALLALAASAMSCSPDEARARLPLIGGAAKSVGHVDPGQIVISFNTSDPSLVPDDYSVAAATVISPLITGWSPRKQMVSEGELLSYVHPLLGAITIAVHISPPDTVTFNGAIRDSQSRFTAVVRNDGTFHFEQIIAASVIETAEPPVQSYQTYAHSTFTGTMAPDGGYSGHGTAVSLGSTVAYPHPPNPSIAMATGTEGYCLTYEVKSVPSKSFFGIEFYPWDDGYSDSAPTTISAAASSVYDRRVTAKSHDPNSGYSYMFYWRSGFFYQIPWGVFTRYDIPETWNRF